MDTKELRFNEERHEVPPEQGVAKIDRQRDGACYENKGFSDDSSSSKGELSDKAEEEPNRKVSKSVMISEEKPDVSPKDGYVNNAFEDGPQNTDKGTVPRARETTDVTSVTSENQISKLDEDHNGMVAVDLETKEKKWKVQSVGWDSSRSAMLLGLVLAFDAWAVVFYCFKSNILTNILN